MVQYPKGGDAVKRPSPKSNRKESWASRRYAIADRLEAQGQFKKAWRVRNCRPRKEGGIPCKKPQLCDYCRLVHALGVKGEYAARASYVATQRPGTILYWTTLVIGEGTSYDVQAGELLDLLREMPSRSNAWSEVDGVLRFIDPARAANGMWRSHLHCILAVDVDTTDSSWHHRRLVLAWARAAWAHLHPQDPVPASKKSERALRRFVRSQDIRPLLCYGQDRLMTPTTPVFDPDALVEDVQRLCEYALMRKDDRPSRPGHRRMGLRAQDHIEVDASRRHRRGCTGSFRSVPKEVVAGPASRRRTEDCRSQRRNVHQEYRERGREEHTRNGTADARRGEDRSESVVTSLESRERGTRVVSSAGHRRREAPSIKKQRLKRLLRALRARQQTLRELPETEWTPSVGARPRRARTRATRARRPGTHGPRVRSRPPRPRNSSGHAAGGSARA